MAIRPQQHQSGIQCRAALDVLAVRVASVRGHRTAALKFQGGETEQASQNHCSLAGHHDDKSGETGTARIRPPCERERPKATKLPNERQTRKKAGTSFVSSCLCIRTSICSSEPSFSCEALVQSFFWNSLNAGDYLLALPSAQLSPMSPFTCPLCILVCLQLVWFLKHSLSYMSM